MLSKSEFIAAWGPQGYRETWDGYTQSWFEPVMQLVRPLCYGGALEIGPGAGLWSQALLPLCEHLTCVDIIPQSFQSDRLTWITRSDDEYDLREVKTDSMDFVFSYGTFCHFDHGALRSYLREVARVMRATGSGLVMTGSTEGITKAFGTGHEDPAYFPLTLTEAQSMMLDCGLLAEPTLQYRDHLFKISKCGIVQQ